MLIVNVKIWGGRICFGVGQTSDLSVMTQKATPSRFLLYLLLVFSENIEVYNMSLVKHAVGAP